MHIKRIEFDSRPEPKSGSPDRATLWLPVALTIMLLTALACAMTQGGPLPPQPAESWVG